VVTNIVDYGMDVQAAIDVPRVFFVGGASVVESSVPPAAVAGLEQRGHEVVVAPKPWGGAQAIHIDHDRGVLIGGSDPRKDGCALGY
jgi:gamma-glutamyltranspeptidase/glutathione hydrolase